MRKTINVSEETWKKLNQLKYRCGYEKIEEVIERLIILLHKFKLIEELKGIK